MTIDIDWAGTAVNPYRIFVPRTDMPLVQASPEIRELDVDTFRKELRTLEAEAPGAPWPETHQHQGETTLSGTVFARIVEILPPYQLEFEDGQYSVRAVGANHNLLDVKVNNQVSLAVFLSSGLINSPEIQYASFEGKVSVDLSSPYSGTEYPVGSARRRVNNFADALAIASERGLGKLHIHTSCTIDSGLDFSGKTIEGHRTSVVITVSSAAIVTGCRFENCTLNGTLDGSVTISRCILGPLVYVDGRLEECAMTDTIELSGSQDVQLINCYDGTTGAGLPTISMGTGSDLNLRNYRGAIQITNKTGPEEISIDVIGRVVFASSVVAGSADVRGIGTIENGAVGTFTLTDTMLSEESVDAQLSATHGAGAWDTAGSGTTDWTPTEREQIRGALGIVGTQAAPAGGGHLQDAKEAAESADAKGSALLADVADVQEIATRVRKGLHNRLEIDLAAQQLVLYDDDGTTVLQRWAVATNAGEPVQTTKGVQTKRGVPQL